MKRIAVVTSGADAPGMNAVIRAVVRSADAVDVAVCGIMHGFAGLVAEKFIDLDARAVSGILHLGGTMLGSRTSAEFETEEGRAQAAANLRAAGCEGLIVIGGDGSLRGAGDLSLESGIGVVAIPVTIHNDLVGTDFSIGFDTAVNTATDAMDRIRDTAESHRRLFFIEVLGRWSGWQALYSGVAGGATEVVVPQQDPDPDGLRERIQASFALGKRYCLVVVAEGGEQRSVYELAEQTTRGTDFDSRVTSLGHIQRGGKPLMRDRVLAAVLGDEATKALLEGADQVMVGVRNGDLVRVSFEEALSGRRVPEALMTVMGRLAR
ncbi:MAG: ATP-dependent 6-phosphofructokinase [Egibacteraceae bacterium]